MTSTLLQKAKFMEARCGASKKLWLDTIHVEGTSMDAHGTSGEPIMDTLNIFIFVHSKGTFIRDP